MYIDNSEFVNRIRDIYLPELELKKTTECPTALSYFNYMYHQATAVLISGIYS